MWTKEDERALQKLLDRKAKHEELEKFLVIIKARDAVADGRLISISSYVEVYYPHSKPIRTVEVKFYE